MRGSRIRRFAGRFIPPSSSSSSGASSSNGPVSDGAQFRKAQEVRNKIANGQAPERKTFYKGRGEGAVKSHSFSSVQELDRFLEKASVGIKSSVGSDGSRLKKDLEPLEYALRDAKKNDVKPTVQSYNIMMKAIAQAGSASSAVE